MNLDAGLILKIIGFYLMFKKKEPKPGIKSTDAVSTTKSIKGDVLPQLQDYSKEHKPELTSEEIEALMDAKEGFQP